MNIQGVAVGDALYIEYHNNISSGIFENTARLAKKTGRLIVRPNDRVRPPCALKW